MPLCMVTAVDTGMKNLFHFLILKNLFVFFPLTKPNIMKGCSGAPIVSASIVGNVVRSLWSSMSSSSTTVHGVPSTLPQKTCLPSTEENQSTCRFI